MTQNSIDLAGIFGAVTNALAENKQSLNQADTYNQDHGNNMVQTFQTITQALQQKRGSSDSAALNFAAKQLSQNTTSSSGKLYAQNLAQAASQFTGESVDSRGAMALLQTLIGGSQTSTQQSSQSGGGDLLGALLGGLTGGSQGSAQQSSQSGGGDLLGTLLGGLTGGSQTSIQQPSQSSGGDLLGTLLIGLTGGSSGGGLQTVVQTFLGGSGMGDASHRAQSTQMVVNAFLQALSSVTGKK